MTARPLHLLFANNLYPPYVVGGNEMQCAEVVGLLRARGHRVSVLCGRGRDLPPDPDLYGELEIDLDRRAETFLGGRIPTPWEAFKLHVFSPASYRVTRRLLRRLQPDVLVAWNLYMASLAPIAAAQQLGVPTAVQLFDKWLYYGLYDLDALLKPVVPWKRLVVRLAPLVLQPVVRGLIRPRRMIAVSQFIKDFYVRAGLPAAAIDVIHLAVPTAEFSVVPRVPRSAGDPLRVLYVGSLWEGKGPQTAVRALGRLVRSGVRAELSVCGGGTPHFVSFLESVIVSEGVGEHVSLHGHVPRSTVRELCQRHDVLVFPSEWDEPYAAVPMEAMSCGIPVVGTTAGGTPEAIDEGVTGFLVPPGDPDSMAAALARLARDESLRARLGTNAARVARERFDIQTYVDRLEAYYRGCLPQS
jgi:glycosyltransferase involved in cell wall biosynthesis